MRDLLPKLEEWINKGEEIALASVILTWGSAPRGVGSYMAINAAGQMIGSVSGGCVEGAVIQKAVEIIRSGQAENLHFGVADDTAWDVGLACGGNIDVFVQPINKAGTKTLIQEIREDHFVSHSTIIEGPDELLGATFVASDQEILFSSPALEDAKQEILKTIKGLGRTPKRAKLVEKDLGIFVNPILPSPTLVIIGGVQIAMALAKLAQLMHFRPILVDPRRAFLNPERFNDLGEILTLWPAKAYDEIVLGRHTAIASLSHDPKIDDPALMGALDSEAFYIGALGSKKTQARRIKRLESKGVSANQLARIQGPIGLEIGADNPEEIALAIMGQVIQAYRN